MLTPPGSGSYTVSFWMKAADLSSTYQVVRQGINGGAGTANVDMDVAQKMAAKFKSGNGFDLNDFLAQIQQMKQMGGLSSLMDKMPSQLASKKWWCPKSLL